MIDYILNKLSKLYLKKTDVGKTVLFPAIELEPTQIRTAKQFLNFHEKTDNVALKSLLGFNPATTPWCAGFINAIEKKCGREGTKKLLARSYLTYGEKTVFPIIGDIVVFSRGNSSWQGHVGYYIKQDKDNVLSLGGNQDDQVCYKYYSKNNVIGYRRPK